MGEAKRKLSATWGDRADQIDGTMQIVRFRHGETHRVEFYVDGMSRQEAYDGIRAVKSAFERKEGFTDPDAPRAEGAALWCVHVRGPDDAIPTHGYDAAVAICDEIIEAMRQRPIDADGPAVRPVPKLWPWAPEQHAEILARPTGGARRRAAAPVDLCRAGSGDSERMNAPVTQPWTHALPMMQQSVLLAAIRGPDGVAKYHPVKFLLRWYRRCTLYSAMDSRVIASPFEEGGGSFTGKSFDIAIHGDMARSQATKSEWMDELVSRYLRSVDELPHHFQMHFMHAAEILGYKHPEPNTRAWWLATYHRLVHDLHLWPETEAQLDRRLGDDREQWLERNDPATIA